MYEWGDTFYQFIPLLNKYFQIEICGRKTNGRLPKNNIQRFSAARKTTKQEYPFNVPNECVLRSSRSSSPSPTVTAIAPHYHRCANVLQLNQRAHIFVVNETIEGNKYNHIDIKQSTRINCSYQWHGVYHIDMILPKNSRNQHNQRRIKERFT